MKVSELSEYQAEKTGIKVWDCVHKIGWKANHIISPVVENHYAAVNMNSGGKWKYKIEIENAMNRNFTKSELEKILGDLDDWEVVE